MSNEVTTTEGIAQSLLPIYTEGGKKSRYLSYIVAGFSVMEAVTLAKVHFASVKRWRLEDPRFEELERLSKEDLRKQLSDQLIDIEFTRNFRLILAKDFQILFKDAQDLPLSEKEQQYLMLIRKFYTPQQFAMVKQLVSGNAGSPEAFDFTKTVLTIRLEKEQGSKHGLPQMQTTDEDSLPEQ